MSEEKCSANDASEFRALAENSEDIISRFDLEGRHLYVNSAVIKAAGLPASAFLGKTNLELGMPAALCDMWQKARTQAVQTRTTVRIEFEYPGPTGPSIYDSRLVPEFDEAGNVVSVLSVARDITVQKQAENRIRESEQRYRELVKDAHVVMMVVDMTGRIQFINEYAAVFFGYETAEIIGLKLHDSIIPEYESTGRNLWHEVDKWQGEKQNVYKGQMEVQTRSGRRAWMDWTVRRREAQTLDGTESFFFYGVDITASKKEKNDLQHAFERGFRRDAANDGMQKNLSIEEFASSHKELGSNFQRATTVCVVAKLWSKGDVQSMDPIEWQTRADFLVDSLHENKVGFVWRNADIVTVLKSVDEREAPSTLIERSKAQEIVQYFLRYAGGMNIRFGIASTVQKTMHLSELFNRAKTAVIYGNVLLHTKQTIWWQDLGCYQFVIRGMDDEYATQYVNDQLGPLLSLKNQDRKHELLATLSEIVRGTPIAVAAKQLHVHVQTVWYRKRMLEKLLGVDLEAQEVMFNLAVAVMLLSCRQE